MDGAAGSRRTLRGAVLHRSGSVLSAGGETDQRRTVVGAVRVACVLAGLRVAGQVRLAGVGRTDLLVEGRLVVETDGREHHAATFQEDRRRDARTAQLGGLTLRFTHADVVHRLEETVQLIAEVALAGPRGRLRPVPPG